MEAKATGSWRSAGFGSVNAVAAAMLAAALALVVFYVDTLSSMESAIAVLYGLSILLAAEVLSRTGILVAGFVCCVATVFSFAFGHTSGVDEATVLRLVVSLAAISMTAAILSRHALSKEHLLKTNVALKRSEVRFRAIFEQSRVALWEQDFTKLKAHLSALREQNIRDVRQYAAGCPTFVQNCAKLVDTVDVNDATLELLGQRSAEEMRGSIRRFLPADDACLMDMIECLYLGRTRFEGKCKLVRPDGSVVSVLVRLSFPEDEAGLDRVVVAMLDVTQNELTQKALLAAQSEMARAARVATVGALSASIAHELNQPIGALVLNAQSSLRWLMRDPPDIPSAVESVERIVRDGHRAANILKNTSEMVMRNPIKPEPTELLGLVGETCMLLEHELTSESIVLQTKMPARLPRVKVVRAEFQQVLVNLLNNAIQAIAGAGGVDRKIIVECRMEGDAQVRLTVRDHGPGIPEEHIKKLFDAFFSTKPSGMGIGLSICKSIIEGRGGRLTARNHEDGGALFEVILPVEVGDD